VGGGGLGHDDVVVSWFWGSARKRSSPKQRFMVVALKRRGTGSGSMDHRSREPSVGPVSGATSVRCSWRLKLCRSVAGGGGRW
jgi:hypothetical protein